MSKVQHCNDDHLFKTKQVFSICQSENSKVKKCAQTQWKMDVFIFFNITTILFSSVSISILFLLFLEWGWTAQNSIAQQSFARHFWQQINCWTQNVSTARIQLILAQLDLSSWQKKWQMVDTVKQLTLLSSATYKLKKSIYYL
jgi:hypothetical protein